MIKHSTRRVKKQLPRFYNEVIKSNEEPPPIWRDTTIKVIYKSGYPSSPSNNRPICSILICHILFNHLFFKRLQPTVDASQSVDQAGFIQTVEFVIP